MPTSCHKQRRLSLLLPTSLCYPGWQDLGALNQALLSFWAPQENTGVQGCQRGSPLLGKRPGQQEATTERRKHLLPSRSSPSPLPASYLVFLPFQTPCYIRLTFSLLRFLLLPQAPNCISLPAYLPYHYSPWQHPAWFNTLPLSAHAAISPDPDFVMLPGATESFIFQLVLASGVSVQKWT